MSGVFCAQGIRCSTLIVFLSEAFLCVCSLQDKSLECQRVDIHQATAILIVLEYQKQIIGTGCRF